MIDIKSLKEKDYQELLGIKKLTFDKLLGVLEQANEIEKQKPGRPNYKLTVCDKLVITLKYLREYPAMNSLAADYRVCKNAIWKSIRWVEDILIKQDFLHLEGKKALINTETPVEAVLIDVTECEIERPQKGQKKNYSGKKTSHYKSSNNR